MWRKALIVLAVVLCFGVPKPHSAYAAEPFSFAAIEGGAINFSEWAGRPILVVNTASRCGFTRQYDDLQALYDRYRDEGLVVLAIPSNDFRQELSSNEAVAEFCEVNFNLDLPMTDITTVSGANAHPFYKWVAQTDGFVPKWNFNKILIGPDGTVAGTWGSSTNPMAGAITKPIRAMLERD